MGKETSLHVLPGTHQGFASPVYVYVLLPCNFHVSYQSTLLLHTYGNSHGLNWHMYYRSQFFLSLLHTHTHIGSC